MITARLPAQQSAQEPASPAVLPADDVTADIPAAPLQIADHPAGELVLEADWNDRAGRENWELTGGGWDWPTTIDPPRLSLARNASDYQPPFRSPLHLALLRQPVEGPFAIDVEVRSTQADYDHRDVCLFFSYQDPSRFCYVHLGKRTDEHANQVFLVNESDRVAISTRTTEGTPWDDGWHWIRVAHDPACGQVQVWFDVLDQPVMEAVDLTFGPAGRVGFGSFDDTADFRKFRVWRIDDSGSR